MVRTADRDTYKDLPYGMYVCHDGTVYLFNRGYQPLRCKRPQDDGSFAVSRDKHVPNIAQNIHFWDDTCSPRDDPKLTKHFQTILEMF